ncbi:MAG: tryptophan synthase alpha chain [Saprospiraceae bacterium]|jgi:tryptophan synthase alpha chain
MKNRITLLFKNKSQEVLNVYFTAGHPRLEDTGRIITALNANGVDLIEVGLPYSDPLADGTTIQGSSQKALANGITLGKIFQQIKEIRKTVETPIILMGYYNQVLQYGPEKFLKECNLSGVDGLIIPDLPMDEYEEEYRLLFEQNNLGISFLITPETSNERIHQADTLSSAFIYVVSKSSITGSAKDLDTVQKEYFQRINALKLNTPTLIGFGIHDKETYTEACSHSNGAIIGSAFIRALEAEGTITDKVSKFFSKLER